MDALDLYAQADVLDIVVDDLSLKHQVSFSHMDKDSDCFIALDHVQIHTSNEEKTILGHEMGHCVTGSFYNRYSPHDIREKHEHTADKWAIKKLVPKDEMRDAISKGCLEPWELAEYFGVTQDFIEKAISYYALPDIGFESVGVLSEPEYILYTLPPVTIPLLTSDLALMRHTPPSGQPGNFAYRIGDDTAEPYFKPNSIIYGDRNAAIQDGDVAIVQVAGGSVVCRQVCEDILGNVYLFFLNRARRDADITVNAKAGNRVECFGKVLLDRRSPLPVD